MAELAPPATMKTPVRAGLRARPGPASQKVFSWESIRSPSNLGSRFGRRQKFKIRRVLLSFSEHPPP